jgi:hypothetical protein
MNRVLAAARLHLIHPLVILGVPWLVVATSFAINLGVWGLTPVSQEPAAFTGGVASLYVTVLVVYVQAVTQMLPFAMGLGLSRRTFYLGTALVAGGQAVAYGIAITVLDAIEAATGGWGVDLNFWAPAGADVSSPLAQIVVSGTPMLAFSAVGVAIGIVWKRWGSAGIWTLTIGSIAVVGGLVVLITWRDAWRDIGAWLSDQTVATLAVGIPLALSAVVAALCWLGMRRVVP